jgi:hypothetical protein
MFKDDGRFESWWDQPTYAANQHPYNMSDLPPQTETTLTPESLNQSIKI